MSQPPQDTSLPPPRAALAVRSPRLVLLALLLVAVMLISLRVSLWYAAGFSAGSDLTADFLRWLAYIHAHGDLRALHDTIGDYLPGYYFLLALVSSVAPGLSPVAQIKVLPLLFDLLIAALTFFTVDLLDRLDSVNPGESWRTAPRFIKPAACAVLMLALPSLFTDGALWGQCDSIYISLLLASVFCLLRRLPAACALFFGIALAFKLQAILLAPFLLAALLCGRLRLRDLPVSLVGFALPFVPAALEGRDPRSFFDSYLHQAKEFQALAVDIGNPWAFGHYLHVPYRAGLLAGLLLTILAAAWLVRTALRKGLGNSTQLFFFATLALLLMPYVMPKMHERYMLPAEVFLVILGFHRPRFLLPAALLETTLLILFAGYFAQIIRPVNLIYAFLATTLALFLLLKEVRGGRLLQLA